ncbi:PREDICTED: putative ribonuclease H protein At1g65750-like [Fragaria vesca subsp. vesca]
MKTSFSRKNCDKDAFAKVLTLCWQIWKAKNDLSFRNINTRPQTVISVAATIRNSYNLYNQASLGGGPQQPPEVITWLSPPNKTVKINFDGSVSSNSAASGAIIRDSKGNPILASTRNLGSTSVPVAEATALRDSLLSVKEKGFIDVVVEGDSKLVIDVMTQKINPPWRIHQIVDDIRKIAESFSSISFHHVYREANFAADAVVSYGHQNSSGRV